MPSQTLIFDEENNRFESFSSCHPEFWVTLGINMCAFKDGVLWIHDDDGKYNNFFGIQYDSYVKIVLNKVLQLIKLLFVLLDY